MTTLEDLSPKARAKLGSYAVLGHRMRREMSLAVPEEEVLIELLVCLEEFMAQEDLPSDEIYNMAHAATIGPRPHPVQPAVFVPGDWVRVVKPGTYSDGAEGLVLRVDAPRDQVHVRPRGGKGTTALFPAGDLLLVVRHQQPPPAPRVGDQVIVVAWGSESYGRKATVSVVMAHVPDGLDVQVTFKNGGHEWFAPADLVLYKTLEELAGAAQTKIDKGAL